MIQAHAEHIIDSLAGTYMTWTKCWLLVLGLCLSKFVTLNLLFLRINTTYGRMFEEDAFNF